ncbi:amino acid permease-domain-containing protein [Microdochium trichocladiopsis]|uniref:Amino acid permease-domain-containing protein n=1 Tax=Microdochium trichocladiopsis TaxID=1682393 RepID=A0A9P8Y6G9_9PEZI|nr:amino acid permease-domain-containing protein [Microdochium trichocladiopsis]KAH7033000.1 amino acid permease-domain-containing protein [Microdochium trichocladiopsis]
MAPPTSTKLGTASGVYVPVVLNILSILMFLRFGSILGSIGLFGFLGLLVIAYLINLATALSLSAIASNGEVKGGGAYYLISRSLGPEFGGSIGILFYLSQVLNTSLNIVGLVDCLRLNLPGLLPPGYWANYGIQSCAMVLCTALCLAGSAMFARASNGLLLVLIISIVSIPVTALVQGPYNDVDSGIHFTGPSLATLRGNLYPALKGSGISSAASFRSMFGVLFPATSGIFAGASMSGDLRNPSKSIPRGTLWAMLTTLLCYLLVIMSLAFSTTQHSFLRNTNIIYATNVFPPVILAGECATTFFSALMGIMGAAKLLQALTRDKLLPGLSLFSKGTKGSDDPIFAVLITFTIAQLALFAELNQIATLIAMGYQMTFFVMNLACFLLKIGSAPNFRPAFKFFNWQTAFIGSILSAFAMFFIDETYATSAICLLVLLFLLIHYFSPPKHWGDVSQNLIYHQVRKYLLRLKPEHIKFWRPQIILLVNDPRHHTRLIQFCNSLKKGSLYILGHVIVTDNFNSGIHEAKLQQSAWTQYISEYSRIKAFVQLNMSPSIVWGVRNLILSAGLGGMRPNIAVLGFYNLDDLRHARPELNLPTTQSFRDEIQSKSGMGANRPKRRRRGDTSARLLESLLPTDTIRTESMMSPVQYMTILEDLALRNRLNVAVGKGFQALETPRDDGTNSKRFIDLWPIQMSAEITTGDKSFLTTNFDTYTLILQLGFILKSVASWKTVYRLRVLVFVEYEVEVEEERKRLKALLDKLRIDADVSVFALASGELECYETIINGKPTSASVESHIENTLKGDDWWRELQRLRGQGSPEHHVPQALSFGDMLDRNRRRGSSPRMGADLAAERRASHGERPNLPKKPTVSALSKMGVNIGMHTHQLGATTADGRLQNINNFYEPSERDEDDEDVIDSSESDSDASDADFNDEETLLGPHEPQTQLSESAPMRRRFSILAGLRRSSTPLQRPLLAGQNQTVGGQEASNKSSSYGTMTEPARDNRVAAAEYFPPYHAPPLQTTSNASAAAPQQSLPARPALSRHASSSRFTSNPTPDTKISVENGDQPVISFAESKRPTDRTAADVAQGRPPRPGLARTASAGNFSSGVVPEMVALDSTGDASRLGFSHAATTSHQHTRTSSTPRWRTPAHSRRNSGVLQQDGASEEPIPKNALSDVSEPRNERNPEQHEAGGTPGSVYTTQGLPLSFNDLPSTAQHLVLNELMRRESRDTAVMFTTLPIPEEGTCEDEHASLAYLSDIEVLCDGLPPVLLVLSNNMTVTVSL